MEIRNRSHGIYVLVDFDLDNWDIDVVFDYIPARILVFTKTKSFVGCCKDRGVEIISKYRMY